MVSDIYIYLLVLLSEGSYSLLLYIHTILHCITGAILESVYKGVTQNLLMCFSRHVRQQMQTHTLGACGKNKAKRNSFITKNYLPFAL